jgi:pimeloyl-ACP methyl ester carboxylesterase
VAKFPPELREFAATWIAAADGCRGLQLKAPDPNDIMAVQSSVPTLILVGALDPITPPRYGKLISESLSKSQLVVAPETGHFVQGTACGQALVEAFLATPKEPLDASCTAALENSIQF